MSRKGYIQEYRRDQQRITKEELLKIIEFKNNLEDEEMKKILSKLLSLFNHLLIKFRDYKELLKQQKSFIKKDIKIDELKRMIKLMQKENKEKDDKICQLQIENFKLENKIVIYKKKEAKNDKG